MIDSINPLAWVRAARRIVRFLPDQVIAPWWVTFWLPQFWTIICLIKRRIPVEIVILGHNVMDYEAHATFLKKLYHLSPDSGDRVLVGVETEVFKTRCFSRCALFDLRRQIPHFNTLNLLGIIFLSPTEVKLFNAAIRY